MLYERRHETVTYPDGDGWVPEFAGFTARILANPNGGELRHETKLYEASNGTDLEAQDAYWQYVAPRVVDWSYQYRDDAGDVVTPPPPAERWESFLDLPLGIAIWLRQCIHLAHVPKALEILEGRVSQIDAGPQALTPPTPLSPPKSEKPSASASSA